jgi:TM2 domain-containing membrane protein YozV
MSTGGNSPPLYCSRCGQTLAPEPEELRPPEPPPQPQYDRRSDGGEDVAAGVAYGLWALCMLGVAGIHRFYLRKYITGTIWLFTWGLLGIGQFIDLFLIPGMVDERRMRRHWQGY